MKITLIFFVALFLPIQVSAQGAYWCSGEDEIWAEVQGGSVFFHHDAALYNCCPFSFEYTTHWENGRLVITEEEVLVYGCWCQCCYDLVAKVDDLPIGDSTIVFRWYDEESHGWVDVEVDISIPNTLDPEFLAGEKAQVTEVWISECLSAATPVPDEPEPVHSWGSLKSRYR